MAYSKATLLTGPKNTVFSGCHAIIGLFSKPNKTFV